MTASSIGRGLRRNSSSVGIQSVPSLSSVLLPKKMQHRIQDLFPLLDSSLVSLGAISLVYSFSEGQGWERCLQVPGRTPQVDVNAMRAAAENLKAAKIREILAVATSIVKEAMLNGDHETVEFVASQIGAGSHGHAHSRGKVKELVTSLVALCADPTLLRPRAAPPPMLHPPNLPMPSLAPMPPAIRYAAVHHILRKLADDAVAESALQSLLSGAGGVSFDAPCSFGAVVVEHSSPEGGHSGWDADIAGGRVSVCHATLRNATPHTVQLCALLLLPPPETRASGPILLDPFGVSHQEAFLDDPKGQAVTLPPGATYTATLALRRGPGAAPGPFYHCLVGVLIVPAEVAMLPPTSTQLHLPPPPPFPPTPPLPPASHPVPGAFHAPTPYPHAPAASTQGTGGPKRPPARGMPPNAVQLSRDAGAEQCAVLLAGCLVTGTLCEAKEVAGELDPDAKPFVATDDATLFARGAGYVERAPHVQLFPTQALFSEQDLTRLMLGRPPLSIDSYAMRLRGRGTGAPLPSAAETRPVLSQASVMEEGAWPGAGEGVRDRGVVQALRRYAALLAIDEAVTGTHIRGLDMFTSKLRLAAVAPGAGRGMPARYWVLPSAGMGGANAPPGLPFPGPVLSAVLGSHGGMNPAQASAIAAAWGLPARSTAGWYALGALEVPGLPEKHPDLFFGFPVHVRLASDKEAAEFVCLTVTTAPPAGERAAMALVLVPPSLQASLCEWCRDAAFPGLAVHVRFTFDHMPFLRMTRALIQFAWGCNSLDIAHGLNGIETSLADPGDMIRVPRSITDAVERAVHVAVTLKELNAGSTVGSAPGGPPQRLNPEQRMAVAAVVTGACGDIPFALCGPPGTGKTLTLVETALQILERDPTSRLLMVATAENYSADILCDALRRAGVSPDVMMRVNDPRWPPARTLDTIVPYTIMGGDSGPALSGVYRLPKLDEIAGKRVVVTTCSVASLLEDVWIIETGGAGSRDPIVFTHVLVDEAGQATVPEVLMALALVRPGGTACLVGDPKQLGPIVRSPLARSRDLNVSLLEGLMRGSDLTEREAQPFTINSLLEPPRRRNDPDASSDFISVDRWAAKAEASAAVGGCWAPWLRPSGPRPAAIVSGLLRRNYRSSKALLALPSALFYGGHLVVWAEQEPLQPPAWDLGASVRVSEAGVASGLRMIRPRSSFVFCGVRGRQMRPADVPSFYNVEESEALCALVTGLLETGTYADGSRVLVEDIGVLAPYRKQVQRIRTKLREVGLAAVRVGTVDDFQGQEAKVMFISTVIARLQTVDAISGLKHARVAGKARGARDRGSVTFWGNANRFNVAISRARCLLVVVGHPAVLSHDAMWSKFLWTCARHGTWVGEGWEDVGSLLAAGVHPGAVPQPNGPRSVAAVRAPPSVGPLEAGGASNGASFAEETDRVGQGGPGSRGADGVDGIEAELREIEMLTDARLGSDMGERELQGIAQDLQRVIGAANGGRGAAGVALDGLSARAEAVARSMAEELLGVGFGVGQHGDVLRDLDGQEEPFKAHV